jgi:hypothetical protein
MEFATTVPVNATQDSRVQVVTSPVTLVVTTQLAAMPTRIAVRALMAVTVSVSVCASQNIKALVANQPQRKECSTTTLTDGTPLDRLFLVVFVSLSLR